MQKDGRTSIGLAAVAALLAACAVGGMKIPDYVAPTGGPLARLLIRPTLGPSMGYGIFTFEDAQRCQKPQLVTKGASGGPHQASMLRTDGLVTLAYVGSHRKELCSVYFSFQPKERHTYLLATSQDDYGCGVNLFDATDGDNPRPEPSYVKRTTANKACTPLGDAAHSDGASSASASSSRSGQLDDFKDLLPGQ